MNGRVEVDDILNENHKQRETLHIMQNLIYLIGLDAESPERVREHVALADAVFSRTPLSTPIFPSSCTTLGTHVL